MINNCCPVTNIYIALLYRFRTAIKWASRTIFSSPFPLCMHRILDLTNLAIYVKICK